MAGRPWWKCDGSGYAVKGASTACQVGATFTQRELVNRVILDVYRRIAPAFGRRSCKTSGVPIDSRSLTDRGLQPNVLAYIVAAIGVVIVLLGISVAAVPALFRELALSVLGPKLIYGAIGFRLAAGALFVFASEACSWPEAIGTIGVIMLAAGFIGLFMGIEGIKALTSGFLALSDMAFRLWSPGALLFGAFIVYAAV